VKLIAEPWDVGPGGYQVGNFPPLWTEWNGQFRDTVRDFWRGEPSTLGEFASRITGSSDLYQDDGRRPFASINFVTAHDGFTLRDLVSYNEKHNEANGEDGRDGADDNRSWNCGVEGETDDPEVLDLRARQQRNMLATLMLSQGIPMILQGNNNVYCQDSELSWMDWELAKENADLVKFTGGLGALRHRHPVFRRRRFFQGGPVGKGDKLGDIAWFTPAGEEMTEQNWDDGFGKAVVVFLNGQAIPDLDQRGMKVEDDSFLLAFNAHYEDIDATLPGNGYGESWTVVVDTATGEVEPADAKPIEGGGRLTLPARSLIVLQRTETEAE
jgi:glycogen operon protein